MLNVWAHQQQAASHQSVVIDLTTGALPSGVTYSGNGGFGSRINSSGVLEAAVDNTARFTYSPVSLAALGVYNEPARTNLSANSAAPSGFTLSQLTATADTTVAPDGATAADTFTDNAVAGGHTISRSITPAATTQYTASCYFKKTNGKRYVGLALSGAGIAGANYATIDLDNITATVVSGAFDAVGAVDAGGGWIRAWVTATTVTTANLGMTVYAMNGSAYANRSYTGVTEAVFISWGWDIQAGTIASHIPTAGSTATRTADVLTVDVPAGYSNAHVETNLGDGDTPVTPGSWIVPVAAGLIVERITLS